MPADIRNVALVGHSGAGKTTLVEAILHRSGAISRMGRVEDGSTVCDFDPEEHKRQISLSLALAPVEWGSTKLNLLDTPGYADFVGDVYAALRVADLAVFVVSAVDGVEVQTELIWRKAAEWGVPRMVFINKADKERADTERVIEQLRDVFGAGIAPLELPIGSESSFRGVVDLLSSKAFVTEGAKTVAADIPADLADRVSAAHDMLVEGIVVADDAMLERFLEGDVPATEELQHTLAVGIGDATVFPVLVGSATTGVGVERLAEFLVEEAPSPASRPPVEVTAGDRTVEVTCDPKGDPLAFVFKTIADPYVGQISLFKVLSGTIKPDDRLFNPRSGTEERLHALVTLRGKEQLPLSQIPAGDLAAVAKLSATGTGDTLSPKATPVRVAAPLEAAPPVLTVAIVPRSQADDDKMAGALHRLREEDPSLVVVRDDETKQTLLRGTGETHLAIVLERLQRKFGVAVDSEEVRVPYRETISTKAEAEGKYKKQTGGHGQFGVAWLRVEPLERGSGFEFVDQIVGGAIPRQFIPAVQKGIEDTMSSGGLWGFPVVDVRVTCFDGKYHPVDSSEMSFKMAGSLGFKEAMAKAGPVLLEPISRLEVTVPSAYQGDIMGDLNSRRGRVQGTETTGPGEQTVTALVPTSEVVRYAIDLRSMTGGRGRFTAEHSHYEPLPSHLVDKMAKAKKEA